MRHISLLFTLLLIAFSPLNTAHAATDPKTPALKITASNVSMTEKSTGVVNFTLTSVNGFTDKVGIVCHGLDPNQVPELILPICTYATQYFQVPANGAVSGSLTLYPPWEQLPPGLTTPPSSDTSRTTLPAAGSLALAGLLALGIRRGKSQWLAAILLLTLAAVTGCIGSGGLAMTHGNWGYTLTGTPVSGAVAATTGTFGVTID